MAANADMMGAAAVGATKNFQAAIEKERSAVGTWWQNWGFLAKAEGPNPSQLNEYIAMMEARYAELKKEKPVTPIQRLCTRQSLATPQAKTCWE